MSCINFFEQGAIDSKYNASHWFRYLRKIIKNDKVIITPDEIQILLKSKNLTMFQKVTLERAAIIGSPTYIYIKSLNEPAKLPMLTKLRSEISDENEEENENQR